MNGSSTLQFLFEVYHTNLAASVSAVVGTVLVAVAGVIQSAVFIYVIIIGKKMMFNALSWDAGATKLVRAVIVLALLTATNYATFVSTPVSTTIPDFLSSAATGAIAITGAQGYDALVNQVDNYVASVLAQMLGVSYIADRIIVQWSGGCARFIILFSYFIWSLADSAKEVLLPIGGLVIPFYLFDATRCWTERWYGKIVALMLVMFVNLMLGQVVVYQNAQYMQKFATAVAARPPDNGFNMTPDLEFPGAFAPATPGGPAAATINTVSAIDTLFNINMVFLHGLFLMLICTGMALYIGGASGFSAAPALAAVSAVGARVIQSVRRR